MMGLPQHLILSKKVLMKNLASTCFQIKSPILIHEDRVMSGLNN